MTRTTRAVTLALTLLLLPLAVKAADEGIHVRGQWVLTFYDSDGGIERVVEFENALTQTGAETLAAILSRGAATGEWTIILAHNAGTQNVCGTVGVPAACTIGEPTYAGSLTSTDLAITNLMDGSFELSGSVVAANAGTIDKVDTRLLTCAPTFSPDLCEGADISGGGGFTATFIAPEAVSEGQGIGVKVTISFN